MILHRGDIIHIHFWYGQNEDHKALYKQYEDMFKAYGIVVGCSTSTTGPNCFPIQVTVIRNTRRDER